VTVKKLDALNHLIDCWRRRSVEEFLDCFTEDLEYYWHLGSPPLRGKAKMRKFLTNYGGAYDQRRWEIHNWAENGDVLLVEGVEELWDNKYQRLITNLFMQAIEFRDGKVAKLRDYYEPSNMKPPAEQVSA
jgi:ketosteroid isomerase-like protein